MNRAFLSSLLAISLSVAATAVADPTPASTFQKMKEFVGTWKGVAGPDGNGMESNVSFKLTGAGTTLVETMFEGTKNEMMSMYHMNEDELVMTHYSVAGNQPFMKYQPMPNSRYIKFEFVKGMNVDTNENYMRSVTFKVVDKDTLIVDWQSYEEGKPGMKAHLYLKRVLK